MAQARRDTAAEILAGIVSSPPLDLDVTKAESFLESANTAGVCASAVEQTRRIVQEAKVMQIATKEAEAKLQAYPFCEMALSGNSCGGGEEKQVPWAFRRSAVDS